MGTDLARRAPARPDALTLAHAPRVARSLASLRDAMNFNQDLSDWEVALVTGCTDFCMRAGFNPTSRIPNFPLCTPGSC